jgi:hypothetical protein
MTSSSSYHFVERLIGMGLAVLFVGAGFYAYVHYYAPKNGVEPVDISHQIDPRVETTFNNAGELITMPTTDRFSTPLNAEQLGIETVNYTGTPTALGTPLVDVRKTMAILALDSHDKKRKTPYNLGSYGCAAAIWEYVVKPALIKAYPAKRSKIPAAISHTQVFINFYRSQRLGKITTVSAFDLTPDKTPPGSVIVGVKKGTGDHHMLVAVDVNWGQIKDTNTGKVLPLKTDGITDAYAGNTGLPEFGKPHFRIQEFASHIGFLNQHHGAINSLSPNNYYDHFIVMTFAP